ncbi:hypothetical protein [Thermoanaerobacter uzonensis]|uniref:hypothetical protein n=1 Tax=Thermoanaerobacter uzonensis TaxID=447593 RepID=UPI003D7683FE
MLGVDMHTTIETLFKRGYNKTQIAKILKIDRKTVRNILKKIDEGGTIERKPTASILDPYKEYIYKYSGIKRLKCHAYIPRYAKRLWIYRKL